MNYCLPDFRFCTCIFFIAAKPMWLFMGLCNVNKGHSILLYTAVMWHSDPACQIGIRARGLLLLMHASSAEGSRVAVGLLQVGQGLFVQLHWIFGKPAFYLLTPQMKPAAQGRRENRINGTDYQTDGLLRYEMMPANLVERTTLIAPPHHRKHVLKHMCGVILLFIYLYAVYIFPHELVMRVK